MHFPLTMRYARNLGVDCMGMTGKFHTTWGDFHSFKNPAALQFECFQMLALGGQCSIGDQLPPNGRICPATYELIGSAYRDVARKEPWCRGARPVTEVAVMTPEEFAGGSSHHRLSPAAVGAARMLQELRHQFDVVDSQSDLGRYKLLVLPDEIPVGDDLAGRIGHFLAGGGAVLASHKSGLRPDGLGFGLKALGVRYVGEAPYSPDFLVPTAGFGRSLPATEHVMYLKGLQVAAADGAEVLTEVKVPYFNRTWRHFCSHNHTPSAGRGGYPGVVRTPRTAYFAHPIFAQYHANAPRWCKVFIGEAIELLLGEPLVRVDGPSTLLAALNEQPKKRRWVLHLLHYIPERRGQAFDTVEDVIPLCDLTVSIRGDLAANGLKSARCVPEGHALALKKRQGRIEFTLPRLEGHQMIELR